jgi:hypothetical protein
MDGGWNTAVANASLRRGSNELTSKNESVATFIFFSLRNGSAFDFSV